ncbi:MAG: SUMF1/EgtB/PvdO family nonheme iron enzyme [bacterium]
MSQRLMIMYLVTLLCCIACPFTWGVAPATLSLTTSLVSPTVVGTTVKLTATPDSPGTWEYRFRVKYSNTAGVSVWTTVQEYSNKNSCMWIPPEAHNYTIIAYARMQGTSIPYLIYRDQLMTVAPAVSDLRVTLSPATPSTVGTPLKISVTPVNGGTVEYRFRAKYLVGGVYNWITLQEYSARSTCTWTPAAANPYLIYVYAREKGRSVSYTVFKEIPYVVKNPVSSLLLTSSSPATTGLGTPIKLVATPTGGATLEYQFKAKYAGLTGTIWQTLQEYSAKNTCTWTPPEAHLYTIIGYAREKGTTIPYQVYQELPVNVVPAMTSLAITATPAGHSQIGTPILLTADASGGGTLEYQFKVKYLDVPSEVSYIWRTLQDYGPDNSCIWTPDVARSYTVFVYAREKGSKLAYQLYRELNYTVDGTITATNSKDNATMVWVPGNSFTMGTEYDARWNGPHTQQVTLSGYWIYQNDVTVAQYRAFCTDTGHALPTWPGDQFNFDPRYMRQFPWTSPYFCWTGTGWSDPALQQHPIVNVSWGDAKAYADWAGVHLPTEAQWEYAARGPLGRNYPTGGTATANDPTNGAYGLYYEECACWFNSYYEGKGTWPVGSFPPSWCGATDMAGNVWQWCNDWYGEYSATPVIDPAGPATGSHHVLRGGAWDYLDGYYFRSTTRLYDDSNIADTGFRCVSPAAGP